jgi:tRNA pseudouridine55 synthase
MPAYAVDKPLGLTSHDVVARARRMLGTRRVGHGGTLDPLATGVLVVLAEGATKLSPYLTGSDKAYLAWVAFGTSTPTLDAEGPVDAERAPATHLTAADLSRPRSSRSGP